MDILTLALCRKYVKESLLGAGAIIGNDGLSAYQIAVKNGFTGSETDWLNSLNAYVDQENIKQAVEELIQDGTLDLSTILSENITKEQILSLFDEEG